jgi:hypothetical protein
MRQLKQNWGFLLSAFAFAIVIYLLWGKQVEGTLALGIIGTIVSLYFGVLKYKMENDRMFNELFTTFNQRYNGKLNDLINELRLVPGKKLSNDEEKLIIDYFNLCAEEYLWYSRNRIPEKVWQAWKAGILENLKIIQVNEVYLKETETENARKSYYGLAEELKTKIK